MGRTHLALLLIRVREELRQRPRPPRQRSRVTPRCRCPARRVLMAPNGEVRMAQSRRRHVFWPVVFGLGALLLAGAIGAVIVLATRDQPRSVTDAACVSTDVADETLPSVVTIRVTTGSGGGFGSGEIIRSAGYILTNDHVISAGASGGS